MSDGVKSLVAYIGSAVSAIAGAASANEVAQIVLLVLGCLGAAVTLALNVWRIVDKFKEAKSDGHIDAAEREEIEREIKSALEELKDDIDGLSGKDGD